MVDLETSQKLLHACLLRNQKHRSKHRSTGRAGFESSSVRFFTSESSNLSEELRWELRRRSFILHLPDSTSHDFFIILYMYYTVIFACFHVSSQLEQKIVSLRTNCTLQINHCKYLCLLDCPLWHAVVSPWTKSLFHTRMRLTLPWSDYAVKNLLPITWSVPILQLNSHLQNQHCVAFHLKIGRHNSIRCGNVTLCVHCQLSMLNTPKGRPVSAEIKK